MKISADSRSRLLVSEYDTNIMRMSRERKEKERQKVLRIEIKLDCVYEKRGEKKKKRHTHR